MKRVLVAALMVTGCGGAAPLPVEPEPEPPAPPPAPPPKPACITQSDDVTQIASASGAGEVVRFCVGSEGTECFALDVTTKELTRLAERPAAPPREAAYVETVNPELKVCASESCKSLAAKVVPAAAKIRAATNARGSVAAFLLGDAAAGKGYAEIWDVAAAKRIASFKYARGDFRCGDVAFLGDTVYVSASTCRQPAARAVLYTSKGRRIANVGGPDFGVFGNAHVQLEGSVWAFLEENATQIALQDIAKGKVVKKLTLKPLFEDAGAQMGNPGEHALVRLDSGKLVVITGAPLTGHVGVVDPTTGTVEVIRPPSC